MDRGARHALAETAAEYGTSSSISYTKLSISLPADLVDQVRAAAEDSGQSVSAVIAAAVRRAIADAEEDRLERALALDAEDNEQWAKDALELTARAWSELKW
jgi:metal-responsive CopG/Arc/MetJ family transcriptional regulator